MIYLPEQEFTESCMTCRVLHESAAVVLSASTN